MKKPTRTAKSAQPTHMLALTKTALRSAIGGTDGTIIVENIVARPQEVPGQ